MHPALIPMIMTLIAVFLLIIWARRDLRKHNNYSNNKGEGRLEKVLK